MKKVFIDARMISKIPHGFSRYVGRLVEGLNRIRMRGGLPYEPAFFVSPETPREVFGECRTVELRSRFLSPSEMLEIPGALSRLGADLYHSPTFSSLLGLGCPWIVTIHDVNHLTWGSRFQKFYYRKILAPFARKSSALLTVSEFSKGELAAWLQVPADSIEVVPNALDQTLELPVADSERARVLAKYGLESGSYFLCLSNPKPHKNVGVLVEAFQRITAEEGLPKWPLVLSFTEFASVPGVISLPGVPDEDGRALLQSAGAVCFPSLYEGFGLPPVEAVCAGAPLLVSDIPPHREGLQDLLPGEVLWLDPRDPRAWVAGLRKAGQGEVRPASRASRAKVLSRYSVEALGQKMDSIYRAVLGLD